MSGNVTKDAAKPQPAIAAPRRHAGWANLSFCPHLDFPIPFPLTARSGEVGNTMSMDMVNTFHFISGAFCGHVVERDRLCGATAEVCEVGFEGPTKHVAIVPSLRNQSQDRLPMEGPLRARRAFGSA